MKAKMVYIVVALVLVSSMAAALMPAGPVMAATITVTNLDDDGDGSLRKAIADATADDEINFAVTGTITLTSGEITINKNLTITGPGAANIAVSGNNNDRVFYIKGAYTVEISGMTIQNGNVTGAGDGGGIANDNGDVTLNNCTISSNEAEDGGGIANNYGTLTMTDCTVSDNKAQNDEGGGVWNRGTLTMTNCTVSGNEASSNGGGIYNEEGDATLTNCTISGNEADDGGGIYNYGGKVTMTNCTVSDNTARAGDGGGIGTVIEDDTLEMTNCTISGNKASGDGGGIYNYRDEVTLINCTISDNEAGDEGGGIYNEGGAVTLTNCTISGNMAGYDGGGIYNTIGTVTMTNCTVSGNKARVEYRSANGSSIKDIDARDGGGIYTVGSADTVTLNYCTITDNTAEGSGGGIYIYQDTVVLKCTIVYGNAAGSHDNIDGGYTDTGGESIVDEPVGSAPDPLLGPLQNNGGPTETHALGAGSPAIDACINQCTVDEDQRGLPRPVDGDLDGAAYCDVGAYEKQPPVGGIVEPVDKIGILAPWLGLAAFIVVVMAGVVMMKRRHVA